MRTFGKSNAQANKSCATFRRQAIPLGGPLRCRDGGYVDVGSIACQGEARLALKRPRPYICGPISKEGAS